MKHTPQQLEEMLNAWEDHQSTQPLELPSAEVIQLRPQVEEPSEPKIEPYSAAPSIPALQSSNPITDFGAGDILPRPKVRKNLRRRRVELKRDPSTGDISGFDVFDEEN